jgi:hypothetical protein
VGLDARYAWTFTGGDGAGQRVIDIEQGWTFNHEDLAGHSITQLNGALVDTSRAHGTAVLGQLCAIDNSLGCTGFAPNIASVFVASRNPSLANSIVDVLDNLDFGDVMLLETQDGVPGTVPTMFGPSEIVEAVREACRLATALGIIVVAAGGNGTSNGSAPATNLDSFTDAAGKRVLCRIYGYPDLFYSAAVIVAAKVLRVSPEKRNFSIELLAPPAFPPKKYPATPELAKAPRLFLPLAKPVPKVERVSEGKRNFSIVVDGVPLTRPPPKYPASAAADSPAAAERIPKGMSATTRPP